MHTSYVYKRKIKSSEIFNTSFFMTNKRYMTVADRIILCIYMLSHRSDQVVNKRREFKQCFIVKADTWHTHAYTRHE